MAAARRNGAISNPSCEQSRFLVDYPDRQLMVMGIGDVRPLAFEGMSFATQCCQPGRGLLNIFNCHHMLLAFMEDSD
jgi:hypothetical protein